VSRLESSLFDAGTNKYRESVAYSNLYAHYRELEGDYHRAIVPEVYAWESRTDGDVLFTLFRHAL
jgi:hypothetical protein